MEWSSSGKVCQSDHIHFMPTITADQLFSLQPSEPISELDSLFQTPYRHLHFTFLQIPYFIEHVQFLNSFSTLILYLCQCVLFQIMKLLTSKLPKPVSWKSFISHCLVGVSLICPILCTPNYHWLSPGTHDFSPELSSESLDTLSSILLTS